MSGARINGEIVGIHLVEGLNWSEGWHIPEGMLRQPQLANLHHPPPPTPTNGITNPYRGGGQGLVKKGLFHHPSPSSTPGKLSGGRNGSCQESDGSCQVTISWGRRFHPPPHHSTRGRPSTTDRHPPAVHVAGHRGRVRRPQTLEELGGAWKDDPSGNCSPWCHIPRHQTRRQGRAECLDNRIEKKT